MQKTRRAFVCYLLEENLQKLYDMWSEREMKLDNGDSTHWWECNLAKWHKEFDNLVFIYLKRKIEK